MITSREEALELCKKFDVKLAEHKTVIVTGNNSIYLSDNIDPKDTSQKFYLKGGTIPIEAEKVVKSDEPVSSEGEAKEETIVEEKKGKKKK
jgi:hypothetical protein